MEKQNGQENLAVRKKKRRRVVESSSDGEVPDEGQKVSEIAEAEQRPSTNTSDVPDVSHKLLPEVSGPSVPDQVPLAHPVATPQVSNPETVHETSQTPTISSPAAAVPSVVPAEPEPREPPGETAPNEKKRDHKVLHAARAWLKANVRKNDPNMMERCAALSGLSRKEITDFVEANVNRKPGEWCFTVVDNRIAERKKEQETIQTTTAEAAAPEHAEQSLGGNHCAAHASATCKEPVVLGVANSAGKETPELQKPSPAEPPNSEPTRCKPSTPQQTPSSSRVDETANMGPARGRKGRGRAPRKPKSPALQPKAPVFLEELSCLDAPDSPPGPTRRKFAPLRPGTRKAAQPTQWVPELTTNMAVERRSSCRHSSVSKKGCAMVCDSCGEELLYDGWKLEQMDEV